MRIKAILEVNNNPDLANYHRNRAAVVANNNARRPKPARKTKPKDTNKPCTYYLSAKGCNRGYNCPYIHDPRAKQAETERRQQTSREERLDRNNYNHQEYNGYIPGGRWGCTECNGGCRCCVDCHPDQKWQ